MVENGCGKSRDLESPSFKMKVISFYEKGQAYKV